MNDILKYDPNFSVEKFITYANNVFVQIHVAITTKELDKIKHFVSSNVYDELSVKVNQLTQRGLTQTYDELNVAQTDILNYQATDDLMTIEIKIISRYLDYLVDQNGNYVSGNNSSRTQKENYLTFTKKTNFKKTGSISKCPGCGAAINVNANGKCAYCGTIYNLVDKDWILSSLKTK